ncbi:hypothetical protein BTO09_01800 [Gilvibacter sp. SZ-19]|uniref:glycosyltransferase family 4 protein n=1 Tax=Gilvibacter sp. SZ-19 TaxID=754429 RepID=UPI000B3D093A|nr:glycosyltransferase family 4 protein [Gilvibacter sp. SZ-19]ARV11148.1 hypothetical protein BTO09_01800 [Gilvibacter sp. SZ-19]
MIVKKVLFIGHGLPQPQHTGAGVYMIQLLDLFAQAGCELSFCAAAAPPESGILIDKNIPYTQIALNADSFNDFLKGLQPDIVVFDRFMTEEQYSWRVQEHCPNALRILDTEDLHFLRDHRKSTGKLEAPKTLTDTAKRELAAIFRSDLSLIISEAEVELLTQQYRVSKELLFHLPFLIREVPQVSSLPGLEARNGFCFVGTAKHKPNVQAIENLAALWPSLRKQHPQESMHIYGSYFTESILQLHKPQLGFYVHGFVEDLDAALRSHKLLLAPLQFGAGQKRKVFDAWLAGCPVVTTAVGAEGIGGTNDFGGEIASDVAADFIASVAKLLDPKAWQTAQNKGIELLDTQFNWNTSAKGFQDTIDKRLRNREIYRQNNTIGQMLWHHSLQSSKYLSKWIMAKNS